LVVYITAQLRRKTDGQEFHTEPIFSTDYGYESRRKGQAYCNIAILQSKSLSIQSLIFH